MFNVKPHNVLSTKMYRLYRKMPIYDYLSSYRKSHALTPVLNLQQVGEGDMLVVFEFLHRHSVL